MIEFWTNQYFFVSFDGRVLEVFEATNGVKAKRAHVATLGDVTLETDRKGRASLKVVNLKGLPVHSLPVDEHQVPAAQQLVAAIAAARG